MISTDSHLPYLPDSAIHGGTRLYDHHIFSDHSIFSSDRAATKRHDYAPSMLVINGTIELRDRHCFYEPLPTRRSNFSTRSSARRCVYRRNICIVLWPVIAATSWSLNPISTKREVASCLRS